MANTDRVRARADRAQGGQLFLVADRGGDISALNMEGHGLYFRDMRHLSLFEMDISGTRLSLLSAVGELNFMSNRSSPTTQLLGQDGAGARRAAHDQRPPQPIPARRTCTSGSELFNYNPYALSLTMRFTFGADFRDMFEVRGFEVDRCRRPRRSRADRDRTRRRAAGLSRSGRPERRTRIVFEPRTRQRRNRARPR